MTGLVKSKFYLIVKKRPKTGLLYLKEVKYGCCGKPKIGYITPTKQLNAAKKFTTEGDANDFLMLWNRIDKAVVKNPYEWEIKAYTEISNGVLIPEITF